MSEVGTLLYLDGVSVSFDGFRALNALSFLLDHGEELLEVVQLLLARDERVVPQTGL